MVIMDLRELLQQVLIFNVTIEDLLGLALVLMAAKALKWLINGVLLEKFFVSRGVDEGRRVAVRQFLIYIVYIAAVFMILQILGISSMLLASSAALLVGIGLGLQEMFKDLTSGIIILIEGTIKVGDVVEVDGLVAFVRKIGLRISVVETRDRVTILIPNSKLVVDKVINWSHLDTATRFIIKVGVAYGSDLELVVKLLLQAAKEHPKVLTTPSPSVQFRNFGDSSLDFELLFFSDDFIRIEFVKSEIRMTIDRLFRQNSVQIPFPQRDLWLKNPEALKMEKPDSIA
ncbi:MAG: mechanosensitive ion channel [Lewinellaceae bacterium]|nr:mechanosensitive ion channel [Lewinellaceae bacterium]